MSRRMPRRRPLRVASRLGRNEDGFVLVFLAVCLPALIGLVGLAVDGARLMTLDTQLAALADASALAAASRLDRSDDAIPAARAAGIALSNRPAFAETGGTGLRLSFRFAATLSDLQQPSFSLPDAASAQAVYVEVTTAEVSLTTSFLQLVGAQAAPLRRSAIAESQYYACDVTPAVLCQPNPDVFAATARPGRQYLLRMDGNTVAGSILLLGRSGRSAPRQSLRDLASNAPAFCYADRVALRRTIAPQEFDEALNVRFDRYVTRAGASIAPDLAAYPPAPNVIQGRHLDTCLSSPQGGSIDPPYPLPRDAAYNGFSPHGLWNQGSGDWKAAPARGGLGLPVTTAIEEYILWNHADKPQNIQDRLRTASTRWDLYLAELGLTRATETVPVDTRSLGPTQATMPSGGPSGRSYQRDRPVPICYAGGLPATDARRRILYLSVADCGNFPAAATAANLSRYVAKFFLTEPSDLGVTLAEFVQFVRPADDDGKLRHVVQLVAAD